jgi:hypothetical protein
MQTARFWQTSGLTAFPGTRFDTPMGRRFGVALC